MYLIYKIGLILIFLRFLYVSYIIILHIKNIIQKLKQKFKKY